MRRCVFIVVKDYFTIYEERFPEKKTMLRRISLYLRRGGILTMEQLCTIVLGNPDELMKIRNIGPNSIGLLTEICNQYQKNI